MTERQALLKSIKKWETICFERETFSSNSCPLCERKLAWVKCSDGECPIALVTGAEECRGTKFYTTTQWRNSQVYNGRKRYGRRDSDMAMLFLLYHLYHEYYGDA
jgi:hypothetical protein